MKKQGGGIRVCRFLWVGIIKRERETSIGIVFPKIEFVFRVQTFELSPFRYYDGKES